MSGVLLKKPRETHASLMKHQRTRHCRGQWLGLGRLGAQGGAGPTAGLLSGFYLGTYLSNNA